MQREKSQLCEEEGSREAQGSQKSFKSNLSQNGLRDPSFGKGKILQNSKNQTSKKLSHYRALSGKRAGLQTMLLLVWWRKGKKKTQSKKSPSRMLRSSSVWITECRRLQAEGFNSQNCLEGGSGAYLWEHKHTDIFACSCADQS